VSLPLAALRERLPGLEGDRLVQIGDGWDSEVHVVDGTWVIRIPRRPKVAARVHAEVALLAELGAALPIAVPRVEAAAADGSGWLAYRWIEGEPIGPGAPAADVAAFLSALHRFPVERAAELGVAYPDWEADMGALLDDFARRVSPLLDPHERVLAARRFAAFRADPASFSFRPALIHADLGPEHLLCGPDGRLVGVIDWTDARIGDPALDFAWLLNGLGPGFARDLLASYEEETDPGLTQRAAFFHLLGPWHEVAYGPDLGLTGSVESGLAGVRERLR
jgi:aminoglycoside phosphotransferase (APT) family kinase protein